MHLRKITICCEQLPWEKIVTQWAEIISEQNFIILAPPLSRYIDDEIHTAGVKNL